MTRSFFFFVLTVFPGFTACSSTTETPQDDKPIPEQVDSSDLMRASQADCEGSFGLAVELFEAGSVGRPSLTGDGTELYLVRNSEPDRQEVIVARRDSVVDAFSEPTVVEELSEHCPPEDHTRRVHVSSDGLRLYMNCSLGMGVTADDRQRLFVLSRESRAARFGEPLHVGDFYHSPAVAVDELTIFGGPIYGALGDAAGTYFAERDDLHSEFGEPQLLPGLEEDWIYAPTLSPDGLQLVGLGEGDDLMRLVITERASTEAPFDPPSPLDIVPEGVLAVGSPGMSLDCRSLYFAGLTEDDRVVLFESRR